MKLKNKKILLLFSLMLLLNSCMGLHVTPMGLYVAPVSNKPIRGAAMTVQEHETMEIIGFVDVKFEALMSNDNPTLLRKSHDELLKEANKYYGDNIKIRNIEIRKKNSKKNLVFLLGGGYRTHYIMVNAKGMILKQKNVEENDDM